MSRYPSSIWLLSVSAVFVVLILIVNVFRKKVEINVPIQASAQGTLSTDQAKNHIGEAATVCGIVVSLHYGGGGRTFVYFDKDWPHEIFTVSIRAKDWDKLSPKPDSWKGKQVCVTGAIRLYYGAPDIMAESPGQISVK
jgi:hypothetical protein